MDLVVHPFHDAATGSWSYVLANPGARACAVVDPVLDYDPATGVAGTAGADRLIEVVRANGYTVEWILETHVHADHLSAARYLKDCFVCAQVAVGRGVVDMQARLLPELGVHAPADGRQFDRLLDDGERVCIGHTCGRVMATPGHTPGCISYVFDGYAVVGDTLFAPDAGTARCDFPGGDPVALYGSLRRLYDLPGDTRLLLCHDYPPPERDRRFWVRVDEQRERNVMMRATTTLDAFAAARRDRDATLGRPALIDVAVPANLLGGILPGPVAPAIEAAAGAPEVGTASAGS
jgi:glyoxylase-like metal-dependent hydrolase (beta-lactamase superfamily II)